MNRFMKLALCAAVLAAPVAAGAQGTRSITLGGSGGLSIPMGDISDDYSAGYSVAGHIFVTPANRTSLGFRGDVSYDAFSSKDEIAGTKGNLSSIGFLGNLLLKGGDPDGQRRPYVVAGVGVIRTKAQVDVSTVGFSSQSTDFAVQGGVGMEFLLSGFSTFAEVKYVNGFLEGGSFNYVPLTFGIKF
jgi:opacity protein-like surface antigen